MHSINRFDGIQSWFWSKCKQAWSLEYYGAPILGIYQYYWLTLFCIYCNMIIFVVAVRFCMGQRTELPQMELPVFKYEYRFLYNIMTERNDRFELEERMEQQE